MVLTICLLNRMPSIGMKKQCADIAEATHGNNKQKEEEEEIDSGFDIDHEELIHATQFASNVVESQT